MNSDRKTKQLLKILIGAAWLDGVIQPEEREYLHQMAIRENLANDPTIQPLLSELKPVSPEECYTWLEEYLGNSPTTEDYNRLLEAISALIYSDNDVDTREVKLIEKLQQLNPANSPQLSIFEQILRVIRQIYRQAVPPFVPVV